jgi:orotate phosphoribosyltransferase
MKNAKLNFCANRGVLMKQVMKNFIKANCLDKKARNISDDYVSLGLEKAIMDGRFLHVFTEYVTDNVLPFLPKTPFSVGGPELEAGFMAAALALKAYEKGLNMKQASILRRGIKAYGTENHIENELKTGGKTILIVVDAIRSEEFIKKICEIFLNFDYQIVALLAIVDKRLEVSKNLENKFNIPVISLFTESELLN